MRFCILVSGLCAVTSLAAAEPLWVRTYNGPQSSYDEVHAIGADDSGGVVVSGFSAVTQTDDEFVTIKYRPNGDTAWLRHFNPDPGLDGATALAVDRMGNVIVTGYRGDATSQYGDWVTVKYSAAGESLWAAVHDEGSEDRPAAIVADSSGNSYVTGRAGSLNYLDFAVVKYGPGGDEVWVFRYDGGDNDGGNAVVLDNQGNTFVTGYTIVGGNYPDLMTWKLGAGGESLWANVYAGPADRSDQGCLIAVDPAGAALVAGASTDSTGNADILTVRYGPTGDTLWTRRYNGPDGRADVVKGLALDAAGNVYVVGTSQTASSGSNYVTVKYAGDGTELWAVRYAGPRGMDEAAAVALDSAANVYVTGSSLSAGGSWDVVTVKYDSAGNQRWLERWDRPSVYDDGYVLALGRQGIVYVGGRTHSPADGEDYLTLAYAAAGAVEETRNDERGTLNVGPTIVRGNLVLTSEQPSVSHQLAVLLDAAGREVMALQAGANDVSRLAPGVYFVRSVAGPCGPSVSRVVITR